MRIVPLLILFFSLSSPTMVNENFLQDQLAECKQSILEQVEQYVLILPSELGCLPCQYFHAFLQSSKHSHIAKRKQQLAIVQSQVRENNFFCATDLLRFVNDEMAEFNGEYGKKFFQSCTRKLENFITILKKSLLPCIITEEGLKKITCSICNIKTADMRFLCGHQLTCKDCEEKRRYHRCLYCDQEDSFEDIINFSSLNVRREDDCNVCYRPDQTFCYLDPCSHAGTCILCMNKLAKCPICCAQIKQKNLIKTSDYENICLICNKESSNIIYIDCNHMSSCSGCEGKASQNICPKCNHIANKAMLREIYL